jgi:hypothetical protein
MSGFYRYGETEPVVAPILTAQGCLVGDLLGVSAGNTIRAEDVSWASAIAAPSMPTATNGAVAIGTAFTNAAYHVKATYITSYGETAPTAAAAVTPTAGAAIAIAAVVLPAGVTGINYYCEDTAGSGNYYLVKTTKGEATLILGPGATGSPIPPAATSLGAQQVTQFNFRQIFLGAAGQRKTAGVAQATGAGAANFLRVDTRGVWEFDCVSQTFNLGDLVGPAKQTGNQLYSSTVDLVANPNLAIGRLDKPYASATTKAYVRLFSKLFAPVSI